MQYLCNLIEALYDVYDKWRFRRIHSLLRQVLAADASAASRQVMIGCRPIAFRNSLVLHVSTSCGCDYDRVLPAYSLALSSATITDRAPGYYNTCNQSPGLFNKDALVLHHQHYPSFSILEILLILLTL